MKQKVVLGSDGLNIYPSDIGSGWYYEEGRGISIYDDGRRIGLISWARLMGSVERKKATLRKRKK